MTFLLTDYYRGEKLIVEGNMTRIARSPYRIQLPETYSKDLAYLAGYHLGDGYLSDIAKGVPKADFEMSYADEYKSQLELAIAPIFKSAFNISLHLHKKESNMWVARINSKVIHMFLHQVLGLPMGRKRAFTIPDWVLGNKEFLRNFISGFFDAEGSIFIDKFRKVGICLTNCNLVFLVKLKELLKTQFSVEFGVIYQKHNQYDCFEMKTRAKEVILRFCAEIGFRHPNKVEKVREGLMILEKVVSRKKSAS